MTALHDAELQAVGDGLDAGHSLPARWYADPDTLEREQELIFRRNWQYAGRADQVAEPGAFITTTAGPVPLAVVRGGDGVLRALVNVCRHRGHHVLEGTGSCSSLQCPYHAWTYDLDGGLRKIPRGEGLPVGELGLLRASVAELGPFVFVHPSPDAPPFEEVLGDLPEVIASCGVDLDRMAFRRRVPWRLRANWKIGIENYLECYHCPVAHPGLAKAIDVAPGAYRLETHPTFSVQKGMPRDPDEQPWMHGGEIVRAQWHYLWPNMTFNVEPGPQNISVDVWVPDGPDRTVGFTEHFFAPDVPEETAEELMSSPTRWARGRRAGGGRPARDGLRRGALRPAHAGVGAARRALPADGARRAARLTNASSGAATCAGSGSHQRWSSPGSSTSSAPAMRCAR